jgi:hypothetical protein
VVCPECGTVGLVTPNRRDASDFCAQCDFPLFWTPAAVELDRDQGAAAEALRRLPGTAGRLTVASLGCPTCAEANPVGAATCLRCGGPMVLPLPEVEAEPVVVAPAPAPEPAPEPQGNPWWWWLVGAATLVALVALVVVLAVR